MRGAPLFAIVVNDITCKTIHIETHDEADFRSDLYSSVYTFLGDPKDMRNALLVRVRKRGMLLFDCTKEQVPFYENINGTIVAMMCSVPLAYGHPKFMDLLEVNDKNSIFGGMFHVSSES